MNKFRVFFTLAILSIFCSIATAQSIEWLPMEKAQELALKNDKKVLIYAKASWCGYCKRMEEEVFPKESVVDSLHKYYYPVRIDIESVEKLVFNGQKYTEQALSRKFRVFSTPTFIFLNPDGSAIGRQPGFMPADIFTKMLTFVGDDIYLNQKFEEYLKQK
ncbi:MAG TPA: thioredoxin fold domain-containing protein [Balneolaceae bacterium]|nr:thioredoxin fold domain-containing protein [Balneolaceae bacterium]